MNRDALSSVEAMGPFTRHNLESYGTLEIPPTAVGGAFRSDLQKWLAKSTESSQRQLGDCSDPTSSPSLRIHALVRKYLALDLNEPPTAVGGIRFSAEECCYVGWI
jgi:hypothetical protein